MKFFRIKTAIYDENNDAENTMALILRQHCR